MKNLIKRIWSSIKTRWKQFVKNHIVDDYPYDDKL